MEHHRDGATTTTATTTRCRVGRRSSGWWCCYHPLGSLAAAQCDAAAAARDPKVEITIPKALNRCARRRRAVGTAVPPTRARTRARAGVAVGDEVDAVVEEDEVAVAEAEVAEGGQGGRGGGGDVGPGRFAAEDAVVAVEGGGVGRGDADQGLAPC